MDITELKNKRVIPGVKLDQLVSYVEKKWGHEEWIVNNSKYCGKKLVFKKGFRCSIHHHKIKDETFYVSAGKILLEMEMDGKKTTRLMTPGDVQHIKTGMWHRITGIVDSAVIEFSTFHMDEDSYRKTESGSIDLKSLGF